MYSDGTNQLCVPETLSAVQSIVGAISLNGLNLTTVLSDAQNLASSDYKNIACTACIKEAYTIGAKDFPLPDLLAKAQQPIIDTCGASFVGESGIPIPSGMS